MPDIDYIAQIRIDGARFATAVDTGPLDAPVPACGDWTLRDLARHMGRVHRWATVAAGQRRQPESGDVEDPPDTDDDLADWIRVGVGALLDSLVRLDPSSSTWHPFPVDRVAAVWPRRQAQELSIHRWDAQDAIGAPEPIEAVMASDGIDEYFELALPRLVSRGSVDLPVASLHVHCTDVDGEWTVRAGDDGVQMTREHAKGDAALRGRAEDLLLTLWRRPVPAGAVDVVGDPAAADEWLRLGGM